MMTATDLEAFFGDGWNGHDVEFHRLLVHDLGVLLFLEEDKSYRFPAGLFDGEGSTSTYIPKRKTYVRRQMAVSQGGLPGHAPAVLTRFKGIVGVGNITGPYEGLY